MRDHRHRGDRREAGDPVRAPGLDRVDVSGGDDLDRLVPGHPDMAALAARLQVPPAPLRVADDVGPCPDRVAEALLRLAVHLHQNPARVRIADPRGRVDVPGERGSPRAAPRLVLGGIRVHRRIVGLLALPGDDPVLDVDLPRTGTGAVDAVRGSHDLVVAPAVPVEDVAVPAAGPEDGAQVWRGVPPGEEPASPQQGIGCRSVRAAGRRYLWRVRAGWRHDRFTSTRVTLR